MDGEIRIERAANGFTLRMRDQSIADKNSKDKGPWRDPNVMLVFPDTKKLMGFLEKNIDTALPKSTFSTAFDTAVEEDDD